MSGIVFLNPKKGSTEKNMGSSYSAQNDTAKDSAFIRFVQSFDVKSLFGINVPSAPPAHYSPEDLNTGPDQVGFAKARNYTNTKVRH